MLEFSQSKLFENHKDYEQRERVEVDYTIGKNKISVKLPHAYTGLINITRKQHIDYTNFQSLIKEVKSKARQQGTKLIGINKLTTYLNRHYSEYNKQFAKYDELFDELVILWEEHVPHLRKGIRDDVIYQNVLMRYHIVIQDMWKWNGTLAPIHKHYNDLSHLLEKLDNTSFKLKKVEVA